MIKLTAQTKILLAIKPIDFRKGIDGIESICRNKLKQNTRSGVIFVFINRSKTMIRFLNYDGTGYWLMTKRISKGHFLDWPTEDKPLIGFDAKRLARLIMGQNQKRVQRFDLAA